MSTKIKAGETVDAAMKFGSKRKYRAVRMKVACIMISWLDDPWFSHNEYGLVPSTAEAFERES